MAIKRVCLIILCLLFLSLESCSDNGQVSFRFLPLQIVNAEFPEYFELNQTYTIKVTYIRPSNCIFFEGFDVTNTGMTEREIVAIGSELQDDACVQIPDEVEEFFEFTCLYTDTYVFRFWTGEDTLGDQQFMEFEVPVSQ